MAAFYLGVTGDFDGFLKRAKELQHSYEKFRFAGDVKKPQFEEVYQTVKSYINEILPEYELT